MTEPSNGRRRWVIRVAVLVLVLSLLAVLVGYVHRSDLVVEQATEQLYAGMTRLEAREILKGVPHVDAVHKGDGELFFYGKDEFVFLKIELNRVTRIEHQPDDGPAWDRMRRKCDRLRRSWGGRFR